MKREFKFLFIFTFAMLLISCDDDEDTVSVNGDIGGEWTIESITYDGTSVTTVQGTSTTSDFSGESFDENATMTFNESDNTFTSQGSYSIQLTTTSMGQTQETTQTIDDFNSEGEWSLDGDILTMEGELVSVSSGTPTAGSGETQANEVVVQELTDNSMVLNSVSEQTAEEFGATIEVATDMTITFSR